MEPSQLFDSFKNYLLGKSVDFESHLPLLFDTINDFTPVSAEREFIRRSLDSIGAICFNGSHPTINVAKLS